MRPSIRNSVVGLVLASLALPVLAGEVGVAVRVRPDVKGYGVGETERDIRENDPIDRGLKVFLRGINAYLKVAFNLGGCSKFVSGQNHQFNGSASLFGKGEVDLGDANNPSASWIGLNLGRMVLSVLPKADCKLDVETPQARLQIQGTSLRVLVDPVVGTFVAVDEGTVVVQAKAGGQPVELTAGNWVLVPPGGLPTRPAPWSQSDVERVFQDPPLIECCTQVEPPKSRTGPP
jgi:hypothetical protein